VRSIVKEFSTDDLPSGDNLGLVFFQQKLIGKNLRVHVVCDKVFSCMVNSEDVDYRYGKTQLQLCAIPEEISARCIALTENLGLLLAGIDLMLTQEGEWYCFEVNPSPGFSYYDISPEKNIAQAVSDLLNPAYHGGRT
jgi:glutathione synthase/RimK-type ligase-like ATP-grasp enzyme